MGRRWAAIGLVGALFVLTAGWRIWAAQQESETGTEAATRPPLPPAGEGRGEGPEAGEARPATGTGAGTGTETGTGTGAGTDGPPLPPAGEGRGEGSEARESDPETGDGTGAAAGETAPSSGSGSADPDADTGVRVATARVGSLDREAIRDVVRENLGYFRFCFDWELGRRPDLEERVTMEFVIAEDGSVREAEVLEDGLANETVTRCFQGVTSRMTFPPPSGGEVTVRYPFVLSGAPPAARPPGI